MPSIPFIKGDKADNNTDYRDALPVNYYAVLRDIYGEQGYMLNYYGLSSFATGQGISRGSIWVAREGLEGQYRVSGQKFIKVNDDQSVTVLGDITGTDQASLTYSLNNIAIVAGGKLYYYNPTGGFRQITDSTVGSPIDIVWADFRFILTDGEYLFQSSLLDEEVYEPLDFIGSDFQPDKIWGVGLNDDNELIAFNELTTEYFVNAGADNFSYQRIQLKAVKSGIAGTHTKAEFKDQWYALTRRANT
ncbi:packaged DNA stabilization protein gp10, partial [bacterium]|nr:packaged DNA stabilization protein gp10 [bacterium]